MPRVSRAKPMRWMVKSARIGAVLVGTLFGAVGGIVFVTGGSWFIAGILCIIALAVFARALRPMQLAFDEAGVQVVEWRTTRLEWPSVTDVRFRSADVGDRPRSVELTEFLVDGEWKPFAIGLFDATQQDEIRQSLRDWKRATTRRRDKSRSRSGGRPG